MVSEWRESTLGRLLSFSNGKSSPARIDGLPHPVYGSNGVIGFSDKTNADPSTIVVGRVGSYCGSLHYSDRFCWVTDNAIRANAFDGNDARFLFYLLQTLHLNNWRSGSGQPLLNQTILSSIPVTVPPPIEQRAIAHILGTLDDKIALNRRMNEALEAMARALFKDWFVDFGPTRAKIEGRDPYLAPETWDLFPDQLADSELGPIPEGWDVCELGDLCHKAQYGYTASATSQPVGPKFLRITDINKQSWIDWSRVPYCEATNKEASKYRLHSGDLLIARMADPGHGVLVEEDVETVFASYLIRFRPIKEPHARLLQYWLKSTEYWQLVESRAAGTSRVSLNAKVLSEFPLVIPANPVADAFASQTGALRDRLVESASEIQKLAALRDLLLPKLMSGEVRIPDADKFVQESP